MILIGQGNPEDVLIMIQDCYKYPSGNPKTLQANACHVGCDITMKTNSEKTVDKQGSFVYHTICRRARHSLAMRRRPGA